MGKPDRSKWRALISGRWAPPAAGVLAFIAAWGVGSLLNRVDDAPDRWPRRMLVIERPVAPADRAGFLERLCAAGRDRGYRCTLARGLDGLLHADQAELWKGDVHVLALNVDGSETVRIEMFDDIDHPADAEAEWLHAL